MLFSFLPAILVTIQTLLLLQSYSGCKFRCAQMHPRPSRALAKQSGWKKTARGTLSSFIMELEARPSVDE